MLQLKHFQSCPQGGGKYLITDSFHFEKCKETKHPCSECPCLRMVQKLYTLCLLPSLNHARVYSLSLSHA